MTIGALLWAFIRPRNLGICATADGGMRLAADPDTVRAPDVSFVRAERLPAGGLKAGYFAGAPDLAVEVLSPTDRFSDVQRKVRDYLAAGTRLVWVIDPEARTAIVYRPDGRVTFLDEDGVLDGEDVVPDFSLALADVWVD
jgi:Uma2 family endonuclease